MSERLAVLSLGDNVTPEEAESIKAQFEMGAAWAEAEAALPEGWHLCEMTLHCHAGNTADERGPWLVEAHDADRWDTETAEGPTPAGALRALAARLREARW